MFEHRTGYRLLLVSSHLVSFIQNVYFSIRVVVFESMFRLRIEVFERFPI